MTAYETFLSTEKRGDMATVYEEAVQHPDWCPIQPKRTAGPSFLTRSGHRSNT